MAIIQPTRVIVKTQECRIVVVEPTQKENIYQMEILEAPPINLQD